MSIIPLGYGEITLNYSQAGTTRPAQITFGTSLSGVPDPVAYLSAVIADMKTGAGLLTATSFDEGLTAVNARLTYTVLSGPIVIDESINLTGTRVSAAMPPNVAVLGRRVTNRGGRQGRGRIYLPSGYLGEADVNEGGYIGATRLAQLQTMLTDAMNAVNTGSGELVLLHSVMGDIPDQITALTVQPQVATMRRRLRK